MMRKMKENLREEETETVSTLRDVKVMRKAPDGQTDEMTGGMMMTEGPPQEKEAGLGVGMHHVTIHPQRGSGVILPEVGREMLLEKKVMPGGEEEVIVHPWTAMFAAEGDLATSGTAPATTVDLVTATFADPQQETVRKAVVVPGALVAEGEVGGIVKAVEELNLVTSGDVGEEEVGTIAMAIGEATGTEISETTVAEVPVTSEKTVAEVPVISGKTVLEVPVTSGKTVVEVPVTLEKTVALPVKSEAQRGEEEEMIGEAIEELEVEVEVPGEEAEMTAEKNAVTTEELPLLEMSGAVERNQVQTELQKKDLHPAEMRLTDLLKMMVGLLLNVEIPLLINSLKKQR